MSLRLSDLQSARCSVDSLNRLFRPESIKASIAAAEASEPVIELTDLQTVALLRMQNSTLCRGIATHIQNECQDKPSRFDYVPLVAHGLARRPAEGERWHTITPKGSRFATDLARAKAKPDIAAFVAATQAASSAIRHELSKPGVPAKYPSMVALGRSSRTR